MGTFLKALSAQPHETMTGFLYDVTAETALEPTDNGPLGYILLLLPFKSHKSTMFGKIQSSGSDTLLAPWYG